MTDNSNFCVEVTEDHRKIYLSITHNGYQWSTLNFNNYEELLKIVSGINEYMNGKITELNKENKSLYQQKKELERSLTLGGIER